MSLNVSINFKAFDRLTAPTRAMRDELGAFGARASALNTTLAKVGSARTDVEKFGALKKQLGQTGLALASAQAEAQRLNKAVKQNDAPARAMTNNARQASQRVRDLKAAQLAETKQLDALRGSLRQAGIDTRNLASENTRLRDSAKSLATELDLQESLGRRNEAITDRFQRRQSLAGNISFAASATQRVADGINSRLKGLTASAITLEEAMADVAKVADIDPEGLAKLEEQLIELSTEREIPLSAPELAQITAAAAQANVATDELVSFTEGVAKAAVAFDVLPDAAGTSFAKVKNILRLNNEEVFLLGDAINHLSNNDAAEAFQILDGLQRTGASASAFGLLPAETAAYNASLVALGVRAETGSRALNSMFARLLTISEKGPAVQEALGNIGLDAQQLQTDIGEDASGTLLDFFKRVNQLNSIERASLLTRIFGEGFQDELGTLANGVDTLERALENVSDTTEFAGSTNDEFAKRSATTAAKLQIYRNEADALKSTLGESLLPTMNDLLRVAGRLASGLRDWAREHPILAKGLLTVAFGLGATLAVLAPLMTLIASGIGTWALFSFAVSKSSISLAVNRGAMIATAVSAKALTLSILSTGKAMLAASLTGLKSFAISLIGMARTAIPIAIAGVRALTIAMLANPVVAIGVAIAGAAILIWKFWKPISGFFAGMWSRVTARIGKAWAVIKSLVSWVPSGVISAAWSGVTGLVGGVVAGTRGLASRAWGGLKSLMGWSPVPILSATWNNLPGLFSGILDRVKGLFSGAMERVKSLVAGPFERIKKLGEGIKRLFGFGTRSVAVASVAAVGSAGDLPPDDIPPPPPSIAAPAPTDAAAAADFILREQEVASIEGLQSGSPAERQVTFKNTYHIQASPGVDAKAVAKEIAAEQKRQMNKALFDAE